MTPTAEQAAIVAAARAGRDLVVEAGAGTGKTSTLKLVAQASPHRRGIYVAYNRAIAADAKRAFPAQVTCATAHALAFRAVGRRYAHRLNAPRVPARQTAKLLGITRPLRLDRDRVLAPEQTARVVMETITRFCYSAAAEPAPGHVPAGLPGLDDPAALAVLRRVVVPLARRAWDDLSSPNGKLRFTHDCQPPGTLVRRVVRRGGHLGSAFEDVPIEQVREGDRVVSLTTSQRRGYVRRDGRPVTAVGHRDYAGDLITVTTARGRQSSYTAEHRCVVRLDCDLADGNHVVYLARRSSDYRIGRTTWRTRSQGNALGVRRRAEGQRADALWVLSVHETDAEAALREALVAHQWRIPTWQFRSVNEAVPLGQFWSKAGNNVANARGCLAAHGRQLAHPFWQRGDGWENTRRPVAMRACNLLSGMLVLEPDEVTPGPKGELWAHDGANGWAPAAVNRSHYDGPVYNLDVADDHTYVADGIATHNCYLKLWQLSDPRLACDYVLFDEAQDANPVVAAVVDRQAHAQRILVGDSCQAIYGWRGAIDALARFPAEERLVLSQSFRFGPAIATEANRWLALLDAPLRLRGYPKLRSQVGPLPRADAVLCRTNAEAVRQVLLGVDQARRVALVGGGEQIRRLAQAAIALKAGRGTDHPELFAFQTWAEVQDYAANDHAGADLKVLVDLIDSHGPEQLVYLVDQLVPETVADLVVSTAHKAKGREWPRVRLAGDFAGPDQRGDGRPPEVPRAEAMLAYVAVTRARQALDPAGLAPADQAQPDGWPGRCWA